MKPVLLCLQIESLHPLQEGGPLLSPPTRCLVSPRQSSSCQAFAHQPFSSLGTSSSWCTSPLYKSSPHISPSTFTARASPSDHVQAAMVPNFYQVLGLAGDVALPDIKAAYRQMARRYHPDVCPDPEAEESTRRFIEVQEAYETLSDPGRRASYDRTVASLSSGAGAAARWGWATDAMEAQMDWKLHWEDQLLNLREMNAAKTAQSHTSWGARMRRQYEQQKGHEYAGF